MGFLQFLDLRKMLFHVPEGDVFEIGLARRAAEHLELDVQLLAFRTTRRQIAVDQQMIPDVVNIQFLINPDKFLLHAPVPRNKF